MAELPPFTDRELRFVRELVGHHVASKRAADRPKDRAVVPVLEEVVALQAARQGSAR